MVFEEVLLVSSSIIQSLENEQNNITTVGGIVHPNNSIYVSVYLLIFIQNKS